MGDQPVGAESAQDGTAAERFAEQLRTLRAGAGNPSFRKMAGRSGRISHTTLHEAAAGTRFPSWETTREFVRVCGADEAQWRRRWENAQHPGAVHAAAPVLDAPTAVSAMATGVRTFGSTPVVDKTGISGVAARSDLVPMDRSAPRDEDDPEEVAEDEGTGSRRHRSPWLATAAAVVALVAVLGIVVRGRSFFDHKATPSPSSDGFSDSLIPGDSSQFVGDITYPDGSPVKVNETFRKVWALSNAGKVTWHNRFLARIDATGEDNGCQVPDRVPIGDTAPGETVMISVMVTAPSKPGKCWVGWKMVDENGKPYFPSRRPVYFLVTVNA
ncbi:NBR1-Ig-like domain-containing protein [Actinoplanes regularis]|uniref:NBR1-Ig-like domain-containing protein n=1 Tax=Actinoplanes regularis TaxID=52697 RepID=UPI0024A4BD43|nr:NBR1-Ig-like domain-containing protein [Actinoplanes regularis]GLW30069.1 hypothetical protein Areg01_30090 [Actinoplanes regularis]